MFERHKRGSGSASLFYEACRHHITRVAAAQAKPSKHDNHELDDKF